MFLDARDHDLWVRWVSKCRKCPTLTLHRPERGQAYIDPDAHTVALPGGLATTDKLGP